ncbi:hypothetical protein Patl_0781 [Paraglaciecola sp. T6c]|uniref:hypothetical protein n=1 Tax=Pseudoalteromonas atlantica (strain T6c / ATCC BAA-1087) TaxID=3042615 RepID=UPI00005C5A3B|nr:hypothetical protein [Paraglaciecola sp. T6c]ABG39309.1 hypothetical protein Patl_0781 [Paraglaciecola sp. T6c]
MDMKKIVLVGAVFLAVVYFGGSMLATQKAEEAMQAVVNETRGFGAQMSYDDLSASVFGSVTIDDLVIDTRIGKVFIDELYIEEFEQEQNMLSEIAMEADDIRVTGFPINNSPRDLFEAFIYLLQQEGNEIDLALALEIDIDDDEAELEALSIDGDNIGELYASMKLRGLKKLQDLQNQSPLLMGTVMLQELVVHEASLSLEDDGILDALLNSEAKQKGVSADSLRESAIERGKKAKDRATDKTEKQLAEAGIALLKGDGITLTLNEDTPVKLEQLFLTGKQGMQRELQKAKFDLDID